MSATGRGTNRDPKDFYATPCPKVCPKCGGTKLAISTSDNSGYAWYYWGHRYQGIRHI